MDKSLIEYVEQSKVTSDIVLSFLTQFAINLEYHQKMTDKIHELCKYTTSLKNRLKNNISCLSKILGNKEFLENFSSDDCNKIESGLRLNQRVLEIIKYFDYKLREQNVVISNQNKDIVKLENDINDLKQQYINKNKYKEV